MSKLKEGDNYLSIKILNSLTVKAFKVTERPNENYPNYKGDGVAVWINEYKEGFKPASDVVKETKPTDL